MRLDFDLENVIVTEFGIGHHDGNDQTFVAVPIGADVQAALRDMAKTTWDAMQRHENGPSKYEPSEKHGSTEYLYVPVGDDLVKTVRDLHEATNLSIDGHALDDPAAIFCYFTRLTDKEGRRLTALRQAKQFKGVVKSKGRLIRIWDDTLQLIEDTVFKLDVDFDLLVDSANVHVLHPNGFEFVGKLQQAVLNAVSQNITAIQTKLKFVDFSSIEEYASKHPRAARYLAAIRGQSLNIDKTALKNYCNDTGVKIKESGGKIIVPAGHEMGFLEVLDRRRYAVSLVKEQPERYRAANRRKVND